MENHNKKEDWLTARIASSNGADIGVSPQLDSCDYWRDESDSWVTFSLLLGRPNDPCRFVHYRITLAPLNLLPVNRIVNDSSGLLAHSSIYWRFFGPFDSSVTVCARNESLTGTRGKKKFITHGDDVNVLIKITNKT